MKTVQSEERVPDLPAQTRDLVGEMGIVCCLESMSGHGFIATNLFVRSGKLWRMVHHHAGPIAGPVPVVAGTRGPAPN